jgi:hypothetical protein
LERIFNEGHKISVVDELITEFFASISLKGYYDGLQCSNQSWNLAINGLKWAYSLLNIAKLRAAAVTLYVRSLYVKDVIVKGASTLATWAMTAATRAWNIAAGIAAAVTTAFGVAMAILTSPITLVILAIAALGVGIYYLTKHWDNVMAALKVLGNGREW